jgi:hypothetical protein
MSVRYRVQTMSMTGVIAVFEAWEAIVSMPLRNHRCAR